MEQEKEHTEQGAGPAQGEGSDSDREGREAGDDGENEDAGRFRRGWSKGLGFLSAFKEAIDETLDEAKERGDLSQDRAKEIMRGALDRAQDAAGEARDRLDFVPRREFEVLKERVEALEARLSSDGGS